MSLCLGAFLLPASLAAQEASLNSRIEATKSFFLELDAIAQTCSQEIESSANTPASCEQFLLAIDGEPLATYLNHCTALRTWRDEFIRNPPQLADDDPANSRNVNRLAGIEFSCGENALSKRTQYVFPAFEQTSEKEFAYDRAGLKRLSRELEFDAAVSRSRSELQTSLREQNDRIGRETQKQSNAIEIELLRQQINSPGVNQN